MSACLELERDNAPLCEEAQNGRAGCEQAVDAAVEACDDNACQAVRAAHAD